MVDADNDGAVTYDELHKFLLNVLFADMEVFAKHRMQGKVDRLVTKTLGVNTYDRLNEEVRSCSQLALVRKKSARISASADERVVCSVREDEKDLHLLCVMHSAAQISVIATRASESAR
jgi:hypothetical protein